MQNIVNALLNTVLVSIPEETFITVMTLIFLKRFDMLDLRMWKYNLRFIMTPVIPIAILINIFKYIIIISRPMITSINLFIFYLLIVFIVKRNSFTFDKKEYKKIIIGLSFSFIVWGILEGLTYPMIIFLTNKSLEFFNQNIGWNFMASIPSRLFGLIIISFLIIKHNNVVKIRLFEVISKNNFLLISIVSFSILFNIVTVYFIKLIGINRILEGVSLFQQMVITMGVMILPALFLFYILLLINFLLVKEKQIQQTYENLVIQDDVMLDVED